MTASFHSATFELLGTRPRTTTAALGEIESAEQRLEVRLPPSVREWYSLESALSVLSEHSNDDPLIPVRDFALTDSTAGRLIPIRWENQGVRTWAILLDGSDDPPVLVDVDSNGTEWHVFAQKFSTYVYTCVWDNHFILRRPALVQAQNGPVSAEALRSLAGSFDERPITFGWPGAEQYRFGGRERGVLIWSAEDQADWFVGAADATTLESALRIVWDLDRVGKSFYDCSPIAKEVLTMLSATASRAFPDGAASL